MKKILLLATGGTIAAKDAGQGLAPQMDSAAVLEYVEDGRFQVFSEDVLNLDSSNIQGEEWQLIAKAVARRMPRFDGIVITHGTDTMAYTASMLSFMLRNLKKPVVLTGSQMPIHHPLSDARYNLYTAFEAVALGLPGVFIAFGRKLMRGCRSVKVRTLGFDAFESVNAPYVAEMDGSGQLRLDPEGSRIRRPQGKFTLQDQFCPDVLLFKLTPGTRPELFDKLREMRYRGFVLELFGAGGAHFFRRDLPSSLIRLIDQGTPVVVRSQCLYGSCDLSIYEVGTRLIHAGVIPGKDMTAEAAVTKLMWVLGQTGDLDEVRHMFSASYAGEITPDS
jgi:L-asparaginase